MDFTQLHYFISVADEGSFSKAGDAGFITKQALLKQINSLENEVGIPLFTRSGAGVELNEEGHLFYDGAKKLLAERDLLITGCRQHAHYIETLKLSNVEHQKLLTPVINEFIRRYPDVKISYVIHPNHSGEFRVSHNIIDVGETFHDPGFFTSFQKTTPPPDSQYDRLADFPYAAVMAKDHPLADQKILSPASLADYEVSFFRQITRGAVSDTLKEAFQTRPEALDQREDVDNQIPVTFDCVTVGSILVTCNPYIYYLPDVKIIPLDLPVKQEYGIITSLHPSPTAQRFRELAVQMFRKSGADLVIHHA